MLHWLRWDLWDIAHSGCCSTEYIITVFSEFDQKATNILSSDLSGSLINHFKVHRDLNKNHSNKFNQMWLDV